MKAGFVEVPSKAPPKIKSGETRPCAHPGCPIIIRYKLGKWVHAIRNLPYDHNPKES